MAEGTRGELDLVIEQLQAMEERAASATASGMLHAARTILQELARIEEFGGKLHDDEALG